MGRIYWCHSIGGLGIFMAAIFVPIFLLKNGYSVLDVFVYLLLQQLVSLLLQYPTCRLFEYINPHHLLTIGRLSFIGFFWLLLTLQTHEWPLVYIAFFWALNRTMYWAALHYVFGLSRAKKHAGMQVAKMNALAVLGSTIAPAIGGVIASLFGIDYTYAAAILLILASVVPLINAPETIPRAKLKISWQHLNEMRRDALANAFNGMVVSAEQSIWPMFVSLIVVSYAGIGILSSVIAAASIIVMMYVGRNEEVRGEKHYIKEGLTTYSLTSIGRAVATSSAQVAGLNLFAGIGRALYLPAFMNRYYSNSDGANRLGYITIMEMAFSVGSVAYLLSLIILLAFFPASTVLSIGLVAVAFFVIGVRLIR